MIAIRHLLYSLLKCTHYERVFRKFSQVTWLPWARPVEAGCSDQRFELEFRHEFHLASRLAEITRRDQRAR